MHIELNRADKDFHFEAVGNSPVKVNIDGGCSAIDIVSILRKQKIEIDKFKISIDAEREKDATPSIFTDINIHFRLTGDLDKEKVERAVSLSMEKYCSAAAVIGKTAKINYSVSVNE